ncbi:MAG: spore cortex biosynthesis protein YabQ [Bacillota bacterium]
MNSAVPLSQQFMVFLIILAGGLLTGLIFDLTRALKKVLLLPGSILFLADLLICLLAALAVYQFLFFFNQGEVRFHVYLSFFLGIIIYYFFCSRHLYKYMLHTLKYGLRLWHKAKYFVLKERAACRRFLGKLKKTGE